VFAAGCPCPRGWHRTGPGRLLPRADPGGARGDRGVGGGRRAARGADRWLAAAGVSPPGRTSTAPDRRRVLAVAVRPGDLDPGARGLAVRTRLSHRDLRAGGEAPLGLLRLAVPARRAAGGARGPQGRSPCAPPARAGGLPRARV